MIKVTLSSADMGDVDEIDFDCWAGFVNDKIDDVVNAAVEVEQARFGDAGPDVISGATDEQARDIRDWLAHAGWDAFCGDEWNKRRAAANG